MKFFTEIVEVEKPITIDKVLTFLSSAEITNEEVEKILAIIIKNSSNKVISYIIKD